jgi:integrase
MPKYKDMNYTVRKDGRLMKKVTINSKPIYIYSNEPSDLYNQYIDLKYKGNNGILIDNNNITFKQYAEKWFEINCSLREIATQDSIKNRINHLNEYIGNIKLKNLKNHHIKEIVTDLSKKGYTDLTKRSLAECKRILNDAVINDVISKNVALGINSPKFPKTERKPLTQSEDLKVFNLALTHKYGLFILLLRYCGLRPEEAVALTIRDIDLSNKRLNINKAVSLARNQPVKKPTKNLKNRKVPIPDFLIQLLSERLAYCSENKIEYVFTKETNKYAMLTKQALKTHLDSFLTALNKNIENEDDKIKFSYYQLRHSYCTMLYYAGVKIKKAQELMGHSSADMVYDVYTHLDEERENADKLINDYISKSIAKSCQ